MTAIIGPPYCFFFVVSFQYLDHNIRVFTHQDSSWRVNDNQLSVFFQTGQRIMFSSHLLLR